jgi:hypothetical protein
LTEATEHLQRWHASGRTVYRASVVRAWVLGVLVGAAARSASGVAVDPCAEAVRTKAASVVVTCRDQYADGRDIAAGAQLARALAEAKAPLAEVHAIAEGIGDRPGGAEAWNAVGELLRAEDEPAAIAAFQRALAHRDLADRNGRVRDALALLMLYKRTDDHRRTLHYAGLAYEEAALESDRELRARVVLNIAGVLYDLGVLPAVETLVAEAEPLVDGNRALRAYERQLQGLLHLAHDRLKLARRALEEAAVLWLEEGFASNARSAKHAIVEIEIRDGSPDAAARTLATDILTADASEQDRIRHTVAAANVALARGEVERALALGSQALASADEAWLGTIEALRGRAFLRRGRLQDAESSLLAAIASIERQRADVGLDSLKPWIVDHVWRRPFDDLFLTYVEQGRPREAFGVVQRATARSLLDGLVEASSRASNEARIDLARTGERLAGLKAVARSVRASAAATPPQMSELLPALGGRHVLTYFRARDQVWLAIAANGDVTIVPVGDANELAKLATAMLEVPDNGTLGSRLIPAVALPAAGVPIYVALDQFLQHVPFSALRVAGDFLVKRNPVALVPNAAVLARLAALPRRPAGRRLVLGDPAGDLAGALREAIDVATSLGVEASLGTRATRASVLAANSLQVLHVASHARMTALGPVLTLADGDLPGGEIIDRGIAADVVVLTSCASADPLDRDELGPLAAAFLAAGSHTVVASRWSVDDALAREFARLFYRANGLHDPIRATASAQTQLIARGEPVSRWASFVVLGAGAAIISKGARP